MAEVITRFKLETTQFDSKLRDSAKSLADLTDKLMIAGKDFDRFASKNVEAAKALGNIAPSATNAKDKVKELVTAYNDVAKAYNKLTEEQKNTDYGKALAGSLAQLKGKVTDAKQELYGLGDAMEKSKSAGIDFNSVLTSLGQRFGINSKLMGALTSGTLATTAAITAGAAAVAAATKMWADYNNELSKQSQVTTVTTGLKGDDADNLTIGLRALAKTYGVDFREAINAANTLIQQFGVSGEKALSLLQDGMQGMIEGDGGKLLSMIQQYAPAFQSAGVSASQLVAVIQNSEGGIFTDQNMQAIIMALPKIKMMSENTAKALAGIGIDGKKMAADVESGAMTVFEALQQISKAIEDNKDKTKETGIVMQEMFGRQARTAGDNLGKAIAQLNTNLEETKKQTGSVGESLAELNKAQEEFERTASELFGMNGWQEMANVIKTEVIVGLTGMTDNIQNFKDLLVGASSWFDSIRAGLETLNNPIGTILFNLREAKSLLDGLRGAKGGVSGSGGQIGGGVGGLIPAPKPKPQHTYTETVDESGRLVKSTRDGNDVTEEVKKIKNPSLSNTTIQTTNTTPKVGGSKRETWAPIEMADLTFGTQKVQKVVEVTADDAAALEQIRGIDGVTIADKGMTITATDDEALAKLREIKGVKLSDKVVEVTVDDAAALEQIRGIDGVTIADKGMTVTADTADALRALQGIEGVTIEPKTLTVTVTDDEAMSMLKEIEGVTIADKGMTVTADTADALRALQGIEGVTIEPKTLTVTVTDDEAMSKLKEFEGVKLSDKVIDIVVNDNSDFLFGRSRQDVQKDLQRAQKAYDIAPDEWTRTEAKKDVTRYKNELETMNGEGDVTKGLMRDAYTHDFGKDVDVLSKELKNEQKTTQLSETEQVKQMGEMVGGIQQMVGGIAQLGIEIPEGFQSMLGGLQGIMTILQAIQTIQTVGSVLGLFRNGGIVPHAATGLMVPGNDFSDSTPVMVSSGELILNKAQQNAVAQGLQEERGRGDYSSTPYVDGEKIYLGMNNFLRRSGRGEIVTSRR